MGNAYKCDRCNKLYEFYNDQCLKKGIPINGIYLSFKDRYNDVSGKIYADLCPECTKELFIWYMV